MNQTLMLKTMGITLFLGCSVATVFSILLWMMLPFTFAEGVLATAFFLSLTIIGVVAFKEDYEENAKICIEEIGEFGCDEGAN